MSWFERLCRNWLPHKELGHSNHFEFFTRFTLLRTRWFSVYLHKLDGPFKLPYCHDHPWHFWVLIVCGGYWEWIRGRTTFRNPWSILYRPAKSFHNTLTAYGHPNWSIIIVSRKRRSWDFHDCDQREKPISHWLLEKK